MIKKLRIKFVVAIMIILTILISVIIGSIYFITNKDNEQQSVQLLRSYAENNGMLYDSNPKASSSHPNIPNESMRGMQLYSIKLDENGNIFEINGEQDLSNVTDEISGLTVSALKNEKSFGVYNDLRYYIADKGYGKIIVATNERIANGITSRLLWTSIEIGGLSLFVLFIISLFLSRWMVHPVAEVFEKQKQFISDASHELKTPISVISTNADVLEGEIGNNKWLDYIKSESIRMNTLVNSLLTLARLDSKQSKKTFMKFNLSNAVLRVALPFESTAFETNIEFKLDISENVNYNGNEENIKQVVAILIDNAFKHTNEKGVIRLSLKQNADKIFMEVFNTGDGINGKDLQKIFERFYRGDQSRSRKSGSYGLGLAIAKAIVEAHKGKIEVASKEHEWAKFTVIL